MNQQLKKITEQYFKQLISLYGQDQTINLTLSCFTKVLYPWSYNKHSKIYYRNTFGYGESGLRVLCDENEIYFCKFNVFISKRKNFENYEKCRFSSVQEAKDFADQILIKNNYILIDKL